MVKEDKNNTETGPLGGNSETESPPVSGGCGGGGGGGGVGVSVGVGITSTSVTIPRVIYTPVDLGLGRTGAATGRVASGGDGKLTVKRERPRKDGGETSSSITKRGRARPRGIQKILPSFAEIFANTEGRNLTPHAMTVMRGEDVTMKILSIAEKGPLGIIVISAIGTISNVTLRPSVSSGGLVTCEGPFEILTFKGSFAISKDGRVRRKLNGLTVSLAGPDGSVIGGEVVGGQVAANPIQVILGSFTLIDKKAEHHNESASQTV